MKTAIRLILMAIAITLASCQNNGHIGYLFGSWRVDSYLLDGVEQTGSPQLTTFSFQSSVVQVVLLVDDHQTHYDRFGTWAEDGSTFILDFTHHDNNTPSGTDMYDAPKWLGMTSAEPMKMAVEHRSDRDMTWRWVDHDGAEHVYKLHKTW